MNEQLFVLSSQKKKTSHVLHLLLSIITAGIWIIPWIMISAQNSMHNNSIDKKMERILGHKAVGKSDVETYQAIRSEDRHSSKVVLVIACVVVLLLWLGSRH